MPTRKKIGLIGAGNIGGELARFRVNKELGDVWLFDIAAKENFAKGKALDLEQNGSVLGYDSHIRGTSNWADLEGADVLIITAGIPRKPGQSRDDPSRRTSRSSATSRRTRRSTVRTFVIVMEPARRDGLRVQARHGLRQAGRRHGRRARQRALPALLAREAVSVKDSRDGARRPGDDMVPGSR